jgi:hypothetical protein
MKHVSKVLAAASIAILSSGAHAAIVTYRYDAKVTTVTEYDPATDIYTDVAGSAFAGASVAVGDRISGFFQFDSSAGLSSSQPTQAPGALIRSYDSAATDFISYVDQDTALAFSSMPSLNGLGMTFVQDSTPVPGGVASDYFLMSLPATDGAFFNGASMWLNDPSGNVFGSAGMPSTLDLSAFQDASVEAGFLRVSDKAFMGFSADLTALERADVPEPGSLCLFVIAGTALLRTRRRRA